ncbi:MAG: DUF924 family protein [Candidatus Mycalebacterium zealandia]|nr:MAG: DUF924 family protein [Candidatus Mycalebacterium zealandia]
MSVEGLTERINNFWFGKTEKNGLCAPEKSSAWFGKNEEFDRLVKREFGGFLSLAKSGELEGMLQTPRGTLSFILLTDQFSRNIHRGHSESFAFDDIALAASREGTKLGFHSVLFPMERLFFFMPLMHSEDISVQKISVKTFLSLADEFKDSVEVFEFLKGSADYARRHYEIIEKFDRYPHRNKILGRESTLEEIEFLKQPGSSF